jgi:hypothetical protein
LVIVLEISVIKIPGLRIMPCILSKWNAHFGEIPVALWFSFRIKNSLCSKILAFNILIKDSITVFAQWYMSISLIELILWVVPPDAADLSAP